MAPPKQLKRARGDEVNSEDSDSIDDCGIKEMLRSLSTKMDDLNGAMSDVDSRLNVKMDGLESSLLKLVGDVKEDMDKKLSCFSADVDKRLQEVSISTNRKCDETTLQVSDMLNRMDECRAIQEFRLDKLERCSLENELIITGVPVESNDSPFGVVGDICRALNCNLQQRDFTTAFRLKRKNDTSNRSVPIVIRTYDSFVKQELLSCYFKRKDLNLKDIGFQTSARIFINESLTKANREVFNLASEAKKANLIVKFFTRNGLVYVQRHDNDKPVCMQHISELEQFLPPSFERASSYLSRNNRRWSSNNPKSNLPVMNTNSVPSTTPYANGTSMCTSAIQTQSSLPPTSS